MTFLTLEQSEQNLKSCGGGINSFGINIHTTIYKIDNQQGPTV